MKNSKTGNSIVPWTTFLFCLVMFYMQHKGREKAAKVVEFVAKWLNLCPSMVHIFCTSWIDTNLYNFIFPPFLQPNATMLHRVNLGRRARPAKRPSSTARASWGPTWTPSPTSPTTTWAMTSWTMPSQPAPPLPSQVGSRIQSFCFCFSGKNCH